MWGCAPSAPHGRLAVGPGHCPHRGGAATYLEVGMSTEEATGRDELIIPGLESVLGLQLPPALAFEHPGVTHALTVTDAKMVLVLIGTEENGAPASYWVRGKRANDARRQAYTAAGAKGIAVGDVLTITRTADIEIPAEKKGGKSVFANGWDMSVIPAGVGSPA